MAERKGRVTIKDIAAEAGVTDGTVSRALAGDSRVNVAIRERIVGLARKMGYRPHASARSLRSGETRALGVFCGPGQWIFYNTYYGRLLAGLASGAEADGVNLIFYFPKLKSRDQGGDEAYEQPMILRGMESLADGRVDGGVIVGWPGAPLEDLERFRSAGFPAVLMANDGRIEGFSQLESGAYGRTVKAARVALKYGHKKIGFVGLYRGSDFNRASVQALKEVLEPEGCFDPGLVEEVAEAETDHTASLGPAIERLLEAGASLVIFADVLQAIVAMDLLAQAGHEVPGKVSLLSFGPMPGEIRERRPRLSLLETDLEAAGRQVYEMYKEIRQGKPARSVSIEWEWTGSDETLKKL